jgi:hypothetical protein
LTPWLLLPVGALSGRLPLLLKGFKKPAPPLGQGQKVLLIATDVNHLHNLPLAACCCRCGRVRRLHAWCTRGRGLKGAGGSQIGARSHLLRRLAVPSSCVPVLLLGLVLWRLKLLFLLLLWRPLLQLFLLLRHFLLLLLLHRLLLLLAIWHARLGTTGCCSKRRSRF